MNYEERRQNKLQKDYEDAANQWKTLKSVLDSTPESKIIKRIDEIDKLTPWIGSAEPKWWLEMVEYRSGLIKHDADPQV